MAREEFWHCNVCKCEQPVSAGSTCKGCGNDLLLYGFIYSDADAAEIANDKAEKAAQPQPQQQPQPQYTPPQQQYTQPQQQYAQPQPQYTPPQQQYTQPQQQYAQPQQQYTQPQQQYTQPQQQYTPQPMYSRQYADPPVRRQQKKYPAVTGIAVAVAVAAAVGAIVLGLSPLFGAGGGGSGNTAAYSAEDGGAADACRAEFYGAAQAAGNGEAV